MAQYHLPPPSPLPQFRRRASLRTKTFWVPTIVLLLIVSLVFTPLPRSYNRHRDEVVHTIVDTAKGALPLTPPHELWRPANLETVGSKYAFATFLAGSADSDDPNWDNDHYFVAARILAYQLLHAPETASRDRSIPFVVLVTENVSEEKRQRLRKDGAVVVVAEFLRADWVKTETSTWQDVMTKLRLWELTQFDRICFLDGDTVLVEPLDGVFEDPAVQLQATLASASQTKSDEAALPVDYSFAGVPEMNRDHAYPPTEEHHDFPNIAYLNAGFFVFKPSLEMFNYYKSLLQLPGRFDPTFPEQNLMNYAHRKHGNMPWTRLGNHWNIHYPKVDDLLGGVKSLHEKWWAPEVEDLKPYMESWRWRMEGHFEARDLLFSHDYSMHGLDNDEY